MWTATQIYEFALTVETKSRELAQLLVYMFDFISLLQVGTQSTRFIGGQLETLKWFGLLNQPLHFRFNSRKILLPYSRLNIYIIIKPCFRGRAKGELSSGK
ncbi:hypothetical protein HRbin36_02259 [bacterium HR36]|nr:hypothetical protein HRbin36_02259 [bacterium HR36]